MGSTTELTQKINHLLRDIGSSMDAPECHGTLVGLFCAKGKPAKEEWLAHVLPPDERERRAVDEEILTGLYSETERQLNSGMLDFQPLVPGDDVSLEDRIDALSEWCQGFLAGLSVAGVREPETLPGDAGEIVGDLVNISRAGSYEIEGSEEDEEAYSELLEYVRAGVLLINEEMNPTRAAPHGVTLH